MVENLPPKSCHPNMNEKHLKSCDVLERRHFSLPFIYRLNMWKKHEKVIHLIKLLRLNTIAEHPLCYYEFGDNFNSWASKLL